MIMHIQAIAIARLCSRITMGVCREQLSKGNAGYVTLKAYNVLGQEVATLVNEEMKPGSYEVTWDAREYPSGVYFYRLQAGDFVQTKKLVLLR